MTGLTDTSPEAETVLAGAYRAMSPARKWQLLGDAQRLAFRLHEAGFRLRSPSGTNQDLLNSWRRATLGPGPWSNRKEDRALEFPADQMEVVREVIRAFDSLEIAYALGGSFASSIHGSPRFTRDADVAVEPFPGREALFTARFGPEYYVSLAAVENAVREGSTFNVIKPSAGFKVDVFVGQGRPFERALLARRMPLALLGPDSPPLFVVSREDILLLKLEWFRRGGEVSDSQWSDVLGVLRVQAEALDFDYLARWAEDLGVFDLLQRARGEAVV